MKGLGFPRFEHLSASAFQKGSMPNLDDAISIGRNERQVFSAFANILADRR
jgi:hypothetical protein